MKKIATGINNQVRTHFTRIANDWYAGNWRAAAVEAGSTTAETGLNVATLVPGVASCLLLRARPVLAALNSAKEALFARAAAKIGSLDEIISAGAALSKISELVPGMHLNYEELLKLYGLTKKQVDFLRQFAFDNKLLITVRSRAAESVDWLAGRTVKIGDKIVKYAAAVLKPEQIKIKSVSFFDTKFLGYRPTDIGRVILRQPISEAQLNANLAAQGVALDSADGQAAYRLWQQRISEFEHEASPVSGTGGYYKDLLNANKDEEMTLRWNLADNSVDPTVAENGYTKYKFGSPTKGVATSYPSSSSTASGAASRATSTSSR